MAQAKAKIIVNGDQKIFSSPNYNYIFNKETGFFARWGAKKEDDPEYSKFGPEILDLEISVNGCPNKCSWCYKGNTNESPTNMNFDTFKTILDKMPQTLTQIAFGITGVQTNPDFIKMLEYCRFCGIIPNFTLSGIDLTESIAKEISKHVGALAVSVYQNDKNIAYNTVKMFTDLGVKQTNIHLMYHSKNEDFCYEVFHDSMNDDRLKKLNAIVLLKYKPKGRGAVHNFSNLPFQAFEKLVHFCLDKDISIGFDSCGAYDFECALDSYKNYDNVQKEKVLQCVESCEICSFSSYINVFGDYFPCSFAEGEGDWKTGLSVLESKNFVKDIWFHEKTKKIRKELLNNRYQSGCRKCLIFPKINQ